MLFSARNILCGSARRIPNMFRERKSISESGASRFANRKKSLFIDFRF